jgi:hypothetical protein
VTGIPTLLVAAALVVSLAAGVRRDRYGGMWPRVWWEQERLYRRPGQIVGRQLAVLGGAVALVCAAAVATLLLGTLLAAALVAAALAWTWWRLRAVARACTPHRLPCELADPGPSHVEPLDAHGRGGRDDGPPDPLMVEV